MTKLRSLTKSGFALIPNLLDADATNALANAIDEWSDSTSAAPRRRSGGTVFALRNLLDVPAVRDCATGAPIRAVVEEVLGPGAFAVRGILFDKTPDANWKVPWHQDLSIAVKEQIEVSGFGPWSLKAGVVHVQPPTGVLESMLAVRLHLDDCGPANGPLRVLSGTHRFGRLEAGSIERLRGEFNEVTCPVASGGALLMRPLILHASSAAKEPGRRRVVHLEFAAAELPGGLEWETRVA